MNETLTVSAILSLIKDTLAREERLAGLRVSGEISNFTLHRSGHAYFSLKDDTGKILCVMFRNSFNNVKFRPADGLAVVVNAYVSLYEAGGQLQLNVLTMEQAGLGELFRQYQELLKKLSREGLFAAEHKQKLPKYPLKIAAIVAKDSAAAADLAVNCLRRWPVASLELLPANMQGRYAVTDIIQALQNADIQQYDLIILARGGGSYEDLFCFNDEKLVRFIYAMKTPLITGIGHESDTTLCDLVADLRAPTPTAAIELATPDIGEVSAELARYKAQLGRQLGQNSDNARLLLNLLFQRISQHEGAILRRFDAFRMLEMVFFNTFESFQRANHQLLTEQEYCLKSLIKTRMMQEENQLKQAGKLLIAFNPLKILARGYAIIKKAGRLVVSVDDVALGEDIAIRLSDGELLSQVKEKNNGK